jgi:hypothetical protein
MSIKRYGLLATLVFATLPAAQAQSSPSLNDKRLGVIKATPVPQPAAPESAASAASPTSTGAPGKPAAETAKTPAKALPTLPAPSGRPINEARRAESAPSGIVLPTAGSASQAKPKTGP